jgi:hypothetical protein
VSVPVGVNRSPSAHVAFESRLVTFRAIAFPILRPQDGSRNVRELGTVTTTPEPITIDPHYSPRFYAELWGISESTVLRWFQDRAGVLKLSKLSRNGKRTRVELRIPVSLAMHVYREHTLGAER